MRHKPQRFLFRGRMETVPNIAKELGIKPQSVRDRIKKGKPLDDPVGHCVSVTYKGQRMSYRELSRITGITESTLRHRIHENGMTAEEAVETPTHYKRGFHRRRTHNAVISEEQEILRAWNGGEHTVGEIMDITGYDRRRVAAVLPVRELEVDELKAKREVLHKYGY